MSLQILLTGALVSVFLYAFTQRPRLLAFRVAIALVCCAGVVVVWAPDLSTRVAHAVNIGRGADLIIYLWIALSLIIAVNVHIRLRLESEKVTQLAREIAILNARSQAP